MDRPQGKATGAGTMADGGHLYAGVDIGKTNIRVAFSEGTPRLLSVKKWAYGGATDWELLQAIIDGVQDGLLRLGVDHSLLRAVGVAVPAVVDQQSGRVIYGPAFDRMQEESLSQYLERELGVPVAVETDSTAATVGELWAGEGRTCDKLAVVTWGTGIGAGLILNGNIYRDGELFAEFGHMIVSDDTERCICGSVGCLGALTSGPAIARQGRVLMQRRPDSLLHELSHKNADALTSFMVFQAARQGDAAAQTLLDRIGVLFGRLCANLIYTIQPRKIVFVGGLSDEFEMIRKTVDTTARENCWFLSRQLTQCEIRASELRDTAGVLGAIRAAQLVEAGRKTA